MRLKGHVLAACLIAAIAPFGLSSQTARTTPTGEPCVERYRVPGGHVNSLWRISETHLLKASEWRRIQRLNPELPSYERDDWTYVLVHPDQEIVVPCGLLSDPPVPISDEEARKLLGLATPVSPFQKAEAGWLSNWRWVLPLLLALLGAAVYAWFRRDPTRVGGRPVRAGGINTPQAAADFLREDIARQSGNTVHAVRILNLVRGRVYGWARVIDRVGSFFRRILAGEQAWEVTAQLHDGSQVVRYTLVGCANDVRAGGGLVPGFRFRFVPDVNVTEQVTQHRPPPPPAAPSPVAGSTAVTAEPPSPPPQPTPPPPAPPASVNPRPTRTEEKGQESEEVFSYRRASNRAPMKFEVGGVEGFDVKREERKLVIRVFVD